MKSRVGLVVTCFLLFSAGTVPAQASGKSSTGWTLFRKLQSVRPKALTATYYFPGDISGALYNPSLLSRVQGSEINVDASAGFSDERVAGVMYGRRVNERTAAGVGVFSYDYGSMALNWIEGNEIKERTVSAQSDYLGMFAVGRALSPRLNAGLNVKIASSRIAEEATAYAFAADAGVSYALRKDLMLSLVGQNIGASTAFINKSEPLPAALMTGLSYLGSAGGFYYVGGVELPYMLAEATIKPGLGLEIGRWPVGLFMGYRTYVDDAAFTYGMNIAFKGYDFSYSFTPAQWLGNMHRVAIAFKLDQGTDVRKEVKKEYQDQAPEREKKRKEKALKKEQAEQRQQELEKEQEISEQFRQLLARKPINLNVLSTRTTAVDVNYYVDRVADCRGEKRYIGVIRSDMDKEYHPLQLANGLEPALTGFFGQVLPRADGKTPVTAVVERLEFAALESTSAAEGLKPVRLTMAIDFMLAGDSSTIKVHRAEADGPVRYVLGKDTLEVIDLCEADLRQGLLDCAASLKAGDWTEQSGGLPQTATAPVMMKGDLQTEKQAQFANLTGTSRTGGLGIYYQNSGILFEYKRESPIGNDNYAGLGIGYYQNSNAPVKVKYGSSTLDYTLHSTIIPLSFSVCHVVKKGSFRGKWGVGASVFTYNGTIEERYTGSGVSGNFFIPFEGVFWSDATRNGYFMRLDIIVRLLGATQSFDGSYGRITDVRLFDGNSYGITFGKKF